MSREQSTRTIPCPPKCIAAEIERRRATKKSLDEWEREFSVLVKQSEGRLAEPYKFNRQDAYEEELA